MENNITLSYNKILFKEGDPNDWLYFLKEGEFEITKSFYIKTNEKEKQKELKFLWMRSINPTCEKVWKTIDQSYRLLFTTNKNELENFIHYPTSNQTA